MNESTESTTTTIEAMTMNYDCALMLTKPFYPVTLTPKCCLLSSLPNRRYLKSAWDVATWLA